MNAIEVSQLSVELDSQLILNNLSFSQKSGEKTLIFGENGVGKSTFLRCLVNIILPKSGNIQISNISIDEFHNANHKIGYVQAKTDSLFSRLTGKENIKLFCELLNISPEANPYHNLFLSFELFNDILEKEFYKCSSGMKKILQIYISLLQDPEILILDEPLIGLSPDLKKWIVNLFLKDLRDKTILVASHDHHFFPDEFRFKELLRGQFA